MLDTSSVQAVRVSRDGKSAILKTSDGLFKAVSVSDGSEIAPATENLSTLTASGSWRRVAASEAETLVASLVPVADIAIEAATVQKYRVPENVRAEIRTALELSADNISEDDLRYVKSLAFDESVGKPEVEWVHDFFDKYNTPQRLRGGFKGQKWASKIVESDAPDIDPEAAFDDDAAPTHDFHSEALSYFGIGDNGCSSDVHTLIAVDFDTHEVYVWDGTGFELSEATIADIDEPQVIPLDGSSAQYIASCIADDPIESHNVLDSDPEERNLFALAEPELDYEDLERRGSIIADASGYTPAERSLNAKRQIRGPGGTFGGRQVAQGSELLAFKKAKLSDNPPLVADVAARIQQFVQDATATDESAAEPATEPVAAAAAPNPAPAQPEPAAAPTSSNATAGPPTGGPSGAAIYFAIVDPTDTTAVLEAIAIVKDSTGNPQAWLRTRGSWKNDPATLAKLTGPTPPPVIELTSPEPAKTVLAQVDKYDKTTAHFPTDAVPTKAPVTASGFVVAGSDLAIYSELDIVDAVSKFDTLDPTIRIEAKRIIQTRATALNRKDLLPADWRTLSAIEQGEAFASQSPLYGEYGEVLVAAGHPFKGAKGAERLKAYWTHGKGAAKIRWGTKGDLTRAHNHLAKFVGPVMAWGLSQNYHKSLFGMSNAKHDKLTGQN
jgi:hypothetical protein